MALVAFYIILNIQAVMFVLGSPQSNLHRAIKCSINQNCIGVVHDHSNCFVLLRSTGETQPSTYVNYYNSAQSKNGLPVTVVSDGGIDYSETSHLSSFFMVGDSAICPLSRRGFMVAVLDITADGLVIKENCKSFEIFEFSAESDTLKAFLESIPAGRIVLMAIRDEGQMKMGSTTREVIRSFVNQSSAILQVGYRDSYAAVGYAKETGKCFPPWITDKVDTASGPIFLKVVLTRIWSC